MPQSRKNKTRKTKLENFKNKQKMSNQQQPEMNLPPIRQVPIWPNNAKIEVTGYEWEAIQNALAYLQMAVQASNSVMSRNIFNGVIKMDFEKLNPETLQYVEMTEQEKEPHQKEFQEMLANIKIAAEKAKQEPQQSNTPQVSPIVTQEGVPYQESEGAKIVSM